MIKLIKKLFFGVKFNEYIVGSYSIKFIRSKQIEGVRREMLCYLCNTFVEHTVGSIFAYDETPTSDVEKPFCECCSFKYNLATKDEKQQKVSISLLKIKGLI